MNKVRRAFTLLEVLVAGGILFIVSAAVVGLSNSIIQGTVINNDTTITNRWAAEALELTIKIRDDRSKTIGFTGGANRGENVWLDKVDNSANYGWHFLQTTDQVNWQLVPVLDVNSKNVINTGKSSFDPATLTGDEPVSENLFGFRFVCIEAVGAMRGRSDDKRHCNTNGDDSTTKIYTDGPRDPTWPDCYTEAPTTQQLRFDLYCRLTKPSLNRAGLQPSTDELIRDGNAVKVRAMVLWNDRGNYRFSDIATVLTNWRNVSEQ